MDPNTWPARAKMDWNRLVWAHDHIEAMLTEHGGIAVGFADGARVVIGIDFPAFTYDEPEFAALVAHELAHNVLGHDAWLDANGRSRLHVRRTEREADRLMPWLLANAGYDPAAAARFWRQWGKRHDAGLLMVRKHDGWDEREEFVAAEVPLIADLMAREGRADWAAHFRREIDPSGGLIAQPER
jgi:hypothetical protein